MKTKARQIVRAAVAALLLLSWRVSPAGQTGPSAPLRLEPGLVAVSAVNDRVLQKDYESVLRIEAVGPDGIRSVTDWAIPDRESPDGVRRQTAQSLQRRQDSEHARKLILWHLPGDEETFPGATGPTPSVDVFNEVRNRGEAAIVVGAVSKSDTGGLGWLGSFFAGRKYFRGVVKKNGAEPVRVLVDGVPTMLNTVHVGGTVTVGDDRADVEFWWLDDPATRFALKVIFQGTVAQVVRINRPGGQEDALAKACRSELPGIYFLTDSAQLLPASGPAIQRMAAILKAHPDWTVTIEGHTDNTGSDQHNLDLSKQRAEALKIELVSKHGISPAKLSTAGYGRARPIDTNDTLDGRAHNRRVELSRRC
jgi:outer membrane protein OmpA-like peptidoglycan-associated protein